jgi:hypothetical protein
MGPGSDVRLCGLAQPKFTCGMERLSWDDLPQRWMRWMTLRLRGCPRSRSHARHLHTGHSIRISKGRALGRRPEGCHTRK